MRVLARQAAEQLGYRFISRARLSNDSGFYKVASRRACVSSRINLTIHPR